MIAPLALVASIVLVARSQPPTPTPAETGQKEQQVGSPEKSEADANREPSPTVLPTPPQSNPNSASEAHAESSDSKNREPPPDGWHDWLIIIFTGLSAAATAAYAYFAWGQWATLSDQARHMRENLDLTKQSVEKMDSIAAEQRADTHASIAEASRAATAMQAIATELAASVEATKESVGIIRAMAQTNEASLHASQRALLNLTHIQFDEFGPGHFPVVVLQLLNTGRAAATITGSFLSVLTEMPLPQQRDDDEWAPRSGLVAPSRTITMTIRTTPASPVFTEEDWTRIQSGTFTLAIYGAVQYQAGFDLTGEVGFGVNFDPRLDRLPFHQRFSLTEIPGYNYST
jgi:hypothetical protein